ncbi:MAG: M6 family metalloprotease domain-containing protein [Bacteroidaceae bacterium]|nr:M6 family metalloprotease domain-containing protein [Bacteroidaceae bacterium]
MKKLFLTQLLALMAIFAMAVPAQRGQWKTITLANGSQVRVEAVGDEFCHFWRSATGDAYIKVNNTYVKTDANKLFEAAEELREEVNANRAARFEKYFGNKFGEMSNGKQKLPGFKQLTGVQKGLVLMIEFQDIQFLPEHTPEFYKKALNEGSEGNPELAERGYGESVKQYFLDQSNDKFTVDFDVAPIIRMPKAHGTYTNDVRTMIRTAITELKKDPSYDWAQYDWDNDGEIEMVFVLYAGYGQATKQDDTTIIWPHESSIGYNRPTAGGKVFDTYACANEINWNFGEGDRDSGIGTFCHEFAHCLGYPDLYDVCGNSSEGCGLTAMDYWDLLDAGSYNGDSFRPAPFSIYEKMTAGWISPAELEVDKEYIDLRPITDKDGGDVYIMRNPNNQNEFYAFEPIQSRSWATGFYGAKGLRVLHIDYNASVWDANRVNCKENKRINQYSRYTYIPADGSYLCTSTSQIKGDLYPYKTTNYVELEWNTGDMDGNTVCPIRLYDITLNSDNTISYKTESILPPEAPEGALYYESFNKCSGTGGNDDIWSDIMFADFNPDNEWVTATGKGARKCMIVGTNTQAGIATTAAIDLEPGEYKLTFKAGRYGNEVPKITISDPSNTTTTFKETTFELVTDKWNDCETTITVEGQTASLRFRAPSKGRFFLDEILIVKSDEPGSGDDGPNPDAIGTITNSPFTSSKFFNLNGQKVNKDFRGIVIKNGKKVMIK